MIKQILIILFCSSMLYSQYYVSPNGNDILNNGTITSPYKTIKKAFDMIQISGDTIYLRDGIYEQSVSLEPQISGSENQYKYLIAYEDEKPILDFAGQVYSSSNRGIKLTRDYWHIRGIEIMNAGDNGIHISGHYNIVENCSLHHNKDTGLQISNGGSNNKIINCDSYLNYDPNSNGENADGFAPKLDIGPGNYFKNCRAYLNSDDGWDCYEGQNQIIIDSCWAFQNGYNIWNDPSFQGDGNGFKLGGNYISAPHIIRNSIAFDNKAKGFDQNHNTAGITVLNCTAYRNDRNFSFNEDPADSIHILKNNISFDGSNSIASSSIEMNNSWNGFFITWQDFSSLDTSLARVERDENFKLRRTDFLRLASTSTLIDAGIDVGIAYLDAAPDLGAFEYDGLSTSVKSNNVISNEITLEQNYPNPFNPYTTIKYSIPLDEKSGIRNVELLVYDILGREIKVLVNEQQQPGTHNVTFNTSSVYDGKNGLTSGVYFYTLKIGEYVKTKQMLLLK
ncbi:MAG: right-handed parallel beta-helix repeat-containing protein [Melioribacteraceae bacterium]|nr:right-handed parallel beta-helix repeat-containing protein [Melioribacteraceae bacterium]